jgi:hypothetical protein
VAIARLPRGPSGHDPLAAHAAAGAPDP